MKRKWLCALLCLLPALVRADAPDDAMRLVVYTAHKEGGLSADCRGI